MPLSRRLLLSGLAAAPFARLTAARADPAAYLTAAQLDLVPFLPLPPAAGSAQDMAEMQEVLVLQATRTPERAAQTKTDSDENVATIFGPVLGATFNAQALPRTFALFDRVGASEDETVDPVKKVFARPRPFQANPDIKPSAVISRSGSYPSGHSTRANMMGIILAAMLPERRAAIWARVDDYAESRVIGGVHYRSDIEAGKRAGEAMAGAMFQLPEFRADHAAARAEVRAAMGM